MQHCSCFGYLACKVIFSVSQRKNIALSESTIGVAETVKARFCIKENDTKFSNGERPDNRRRIRELHCIPCHAQNTRQHSRGRFAHVCTGGVNQPLCTAAPNSFEYDLGRCQQLSSILLQRSYRSTPKEENGKSASHYMVINVARTKTFGQAKRCGS